MKPGEAKHHSPTLARLLKSRLAPVREKTLLDAAINEENPPKPAAGDCCGSSCNPCVMDLYREELKVWRECEGYRAGLRKEEDKSDRSSSEADTPVFKVPGAFEW